MPGPRPTYAITLTPEQEARLQPLSPCSLAPFATVQRVQSLLLAHRHPQWQKATSAQRGGCSVNTVKRWRQRWQTTDRVWDAPRAGTRCTFTPLPRAQVVALAGSAPRQYANPWQRWAGEKLAQGAVEQQIGATLAPGTIRRWLRADKIKPWRSHAWQHSPAPQFVEKAVPVLDLYAQAPALHPPGELPVWADAKPSRQARQRVTAPKAAAPGTVMQVADRYQRRGALPLFWALVVARGLTFAQTRPRKQVAEFKAFLQGFFQSALGVGVTIVPLILANGPPHASQHLGTWLAALEWSFEVRLYWLPKYASWLAQLEIIWSKGQRDVLTPNDLPSTLALERNLQAYFTELNEHPQPIQWT